MAGMTTLADPGPAAPPPRKRGRRWLIVGAVAWALLLTGVAFWSARHDAATIREQRSIGQATPVVDTAVGRLVAAAGPQAVVDFTPRRLSTGCRLTEARRGASLERDVRIFVPPAQTAARLDALAERLPGAYRARVRHAASGEETMRADAGDFVGVRGIVTAPGVIAVTVSTGCRPPDGAVPRDDPPAAAPGLVAAATPVAEALGFTAGDNVESTSVRCEDADQVARSVRLTGRPGAEPGPLPAALGIRLDRATAVVETADLVAYRRDGLGVVAEAHDGRVTVVATQPCPAQ
jgi:hypothetical protein